MARAAVDRSGRPAAIRWAAGHADAPAVAALERARAQRALQRASHRVGRLVTGSFQARDDVALRRLPQRQNAGVVRTADAIWRLRRGATPGGPGRTVGGTT